MHRHNYKITVQIYVVHTYLYVFNLAEEEEEEVDEVDGMVQVSLKSGVVSSRCILFFMHFNLFQANSCFDVSCPSLFACDSFK